MMVKSLSVKVTVHPALVISLTDKSDSERQSSAKMWTGIMGPVGEIERTAACVDSMVVEFGKETIKGAVA
jgi:hypothetical protein